MSPLVPDEYRIEIQIGRLLQAGVLVACGVTLVGGYLYLRQYGNLPAHYHIFIGEPAALSQPAHILAGCLQGNSASLTTLGIIILIATPILRVLLSLIFFAVQRDYLYTGITLIVFCLLLFSLLG